MRLCSIITRLVMFLLLGNIVNIGVAWSCVLAFEAPSGFAMTSAAWEIEASPAKADWYLQQGVRLLPANERGRLQQLGWIPSGDFSDEPGGYVGGTNRRLTAHSVAHAGVLYRDVIEDELVGCIGCAHECCHQVLAGWPLFGLVSESIALSSIPTTWREYGGVLLRRPSNPVTPRGPCVLPAWPLWPGFAINTIFYAAIFWLLFFTPGKIRRYVRIKRRRCPASGYKIALGVGPVCSECGTALSNRSSA